MAFRKNSVLGPVTFLAMDFAYVYNTRYVFTLTWEPLILKSKFKKKNTMKRYHVTPFLGDTRKHLLMQSSEPMIDQSKDITKAQLDEPMNATYWYYLHKSG